MLWVSFGFSKLDHKCPFWRISAERDGCLQGLCDLLCLFGQLTQQDCLHISAHNVTVHALKVHCVCHTKRSVPSVKTCQMLIGWLNYII